MSGPEADEEMHEMADVADALGALASVAAASRQELRESSPPRPTLGPPDGQAAGQSRQRSVLRPEMQKWVQCNRCQKWRKVPYNLKDDELPEDWECKHNVWDQPHSSCMTSQALSNEEIDEILALQQQELQQQQLQEAHYNEEPPFEEAEQEYYEGDGGEDDYVDDDDIGDGADDDLDGGKRMRAKFGNRPKIKRAGSDILPTTIPSPGRRGGRGGRVGGARGRGLTPRGGRGGRGGRGASRGGRGGRAAAAGLARSRAGGRAFGRGVRGVSEAAEALLGMGVAGEGDYYDGEMGSMMLLDPAEQVVLQRPDFPYPRETLRPGRVVWAKVEGHDWWPAKIVRRRAVPREVGPPPGGHSSVLLYIPVVFFTNKGIPGEVEERLDTAHGIVAASMRALRMGAGEEEEDEEAEYAWLPLDCLKPFKVGDVSGNGDDAGPIIDQNLRTSIAHAEAAMRLSEQPANASSLWAADGTAGGIVPKAEDGTDLGAPESDLLRDAGRVGLEEDFHSDSDGGWGAPAHFQAAAARGFRGGRGRGGRGRGRGRGRGGRRGRGRGRGIVARASDEEDEALDEMALEPLVTPTDPFAMGGVPPVAPQRTVVEAIYGWRFPLSEQEKAQERDRQRQLELERHRILDRLRRSNAVGSPNSEAIADAVAAANAAAASAAAAAKAAAVASAAAAGGHNPDHMATDEADAAAALLGFGGDDADPAAAAAAAAAVAAAAAAAAAAGMAGALEGPDGSGAVALNGLMAGIDREPEYLVKWAHRSHIHNEWVKESTLMALARRKLLNFKKRHGDRPCNAVDEAWTRPERFVSRRPSPSGPGWELLVKWTGLGYDQATWEAEGTKLLLQPEYVALHTAMWTRCKRALQKASRAAAEAAVEARTTLCGNGPMGQQQGSPSPVDLQEQPSYVTGARLHSHQLQAVSWLRRMWAAGKHAILADDMGLGKTATVTTFLLGLIHDFKVTGPLLVVAPQAMLDFWKGEWQFWADGAAAVATGGDPHAAVANGPSTTAAGGAGAQTGNKEPFGAGAASLAASGGVNVVVYTGNATVRTLLHEQELWLSPSSLDRKGSMGRGREDCPSKVPKADVVIAGYEHVLSDLAVLKAMPWEVVVVDVRQRCRGMSGRNTGALAELGGAQRVLLTGSNPTAGPLEEVAGLAQLIRPDVQTYNAEDYLAGEGAAEAARSRLAEALEARCCRHMGRELPRAVAVRREVQVPVELTEAQAEAYRSVLARNYEVLADLRPPPLPARHGGGAGGHRASSLKHVCNELRKVCHHPHLLEEFRNELDEAPAAADAGLAVTDLGLAPAPAGPLSPPRPRASHGTSSPFPRGAAAGGGEAALLAGSGKLATLDKMLRVMRRRGSCVLVLSQSAKTLDVLESYTQRAFGPTAAVRIDNSTPSAVRHATLNAFNAAVAAAAAAAATSNTATTNASNGGAAGTSSAPAPQQQPQQEPAADGGSAPPPASAAASPTAPTTHTSAPASASASPPPPSTTPFIVLMTARCFGLGTNLPYVRSVIVYDSDWHPRLDLQALRRAYRVGEPGQLAVYRLYTRGTVEERLLQLAERRRGLDHVFQAGGGNGAGRGSSRENSNGGSGGVGGSRALEEILKWGTAQLFRQPQGGEGVDGVSAFGAGSALQEANGGDAPASEAGAGRGAAGARQERARYTDESVSELVDLGHAACCSGASGAGRAADAAAAAAAAATDAAEGGGAGVADGAAGGAGGAEAEGGCGGGGGGSGVPLGPGLELVTVRTWADVDKRVEDDLPAASDEADEELHDDKTMDDMDGAAEDDPQGLAGGVVDAYGNLSAADNVFGAAAAANVALVGRNSDGNNLATSLFWSSLLRERYEAMRKEEEQNMEEAHHAALAVGPRRSGIMEYDRDDADDIGDIGAEDDEADDETYRPSRGPGSMSLAMQDSYDDGAGGPRHGGRGRGRGRGRGGFMSGGRGGRGRGGRRRVDPDADDALYGVPTAAGALGGVQMPGYMLEDRDRPFKRRRRGVGALGNGVADDGGVNGGGDAAATPARVREVLLREVARMEAVKKYIGDTTSLEYAVAQRSYGRLKEVAAELELHAEAAVAISDMACQVADILVMMRQEEEAPSDFQDYTLVAIIAVAAHLVKVPLGEDYGLRRLGDRYGHDLSALDQVFWHILTRLSYYRELHVRSSQLAADGNLSPAEAEALLAATGGASGAAAVADHRIGGRGGAEGAGGAAGGAGARQGDSGGGAAGAAPQPQVVSEVDTFSNRLQAILQSDVNPLVYAQVSAENIPLGPLATLMPLLQMAGVLNDANMKTVLKSTRDCQESLVVLDRSHSIKVQQIQKEYQDFMEKVRSKAQGAIDTANRDYQNAKAALTQRMNIYIEYLQSQIPLQRLSEMAQHLQRTAQQAQASQQHQQQAAAAVAAVAAAAAAGGGSTAAGAQQGALPAELQGAAAAAAAAAAGGLMDPATALAAIAAAMQGAGAAGPAAAAAAAASLMGLGPLGGLDVTGGNAPAAAQAAAPAAAAANGSGAAAAADAVMTDAASPAQPPQAPPAPAQQPQQLPSQPPQQQLQVQQHQQLATNATNQVQPHTAPQSPTTQLAQLQPPPQQQQPQQQAQQQQQALADPRTAAALAAAAAATPTLEHLLAAIATNRITLEQLPEPLRNQLSALSGGRPIQAYLEQLMVAAGQGQTTTTTATAALAATPIPATGGAHRASTPGASAPAPSNANGATVTAANGPAQPSPASAGVASKVTPPSSAAVSAGGAPAATATPAATAVTASPAAAVHPQLPQQQHLLQAVAAGLPAGATLLQQQPAARRSVSGGSAGRPPLPGSGPGSVSQGGAASVSVSPATSSGGGAPASTRPTHFQQQQQHQAAAQQEQQPLPQQHYGTSSSYGTHPVAVLSAASSYQHLMAQQPHVMQRALGPPPPGMPNVPRQAPTATNAMATSNAGLAATAAADDASVAASQGTWQRSRSGGSAPPPATDGTRPPAASEGFAAGSSPAPTVDAAAAAQQQQLLAATVHHQFHTAMHSATGQAFGATVRATSPQHEGIQQRLAAAAAAAAAAVISRSRATSPVPGQPSITAQLAQQPHQHPYSSGGVGGDAASTATAGGATGAYGLGAGAGASEAGMVQAQAQPLPQVPEAASAPSMSHLLHHAASATPIEPAPQLQHPGQGQHDPAGTGVSVPAPTDALHSQAFMLTQLHGFTSAPEAQQQQQPQSQAFMQGTEVSEPVGQQGSLPAGATDQPSEAAGTGVAPQDDSTGQAATIMDTAAAAAAMQAAFEQAAAAVQHHQAALEAAVQQQATADAHQQLGVAAAGNSEPDGPQDQQQQMQQLGGNGGGAEGGDSGVPYGVPAVMVGGGYTMPHSAGLDFQQQHQQQLVDQAHAAAPAGSVVEGPQADNSGAAMYAVGAGSAAAAASVLIATAAEGVSGPAAQASDFQQQQQYEGSPGAVEAGQPQQQPQADVAAVAQQQQQLQFDPQQQQSQQYQQYEQQYLQAAPTSQEQVPAAGAPVRQQQPQQPQQSQQQQPTAQPDVSSSQLQHLQYQQQQYQQQYAAQFAAMAHPYTASMQTAAAAAPQTQAPARAPYGYDPAAYAAAAAAAAAGQGYAAAGYGGQAAAAHMAAAAAAHMAAYGSQAAAAAYPAAYGTAGDPAALMAAYQWQQQHAAAVAQGQGGMEALYAQHAAAAMYLQQQQQQQQQQQAAGVADASQQAASQQQPQA